MTHGITWTHTPNKSDLERDKLAPDKFKFWKKFEYIRTAKRFGVIVHTEVITVYVNAAYIFPNLIKNWNALGNTPRPLNPGLTWHYAPAPEWRGQASQKT